MKKLISLLGAGALLLSVAGPAFAVTSVTINKAKVKSTTNVSANSGYNYAGNGVSVKKAGVSGEVEVKGNNSVDTGKAEAENLKVIAANTSVGCDTCGTSGVTVNKAKVRSTTNVSANSGYNIVGNSAEVKKAGVSGDVEVSGNNSVDTGKAEAENVELIVVNTQVSF